MPTLPPCSPTLNVEFFSNVSDQIAAFGQTAAGATEAELADVQAKVQALVTQAFNDVSMLESTLTSQIALLGPINALLTPPALPDDIIGWITTLIDDVLTPMYRPYLTATAQLAALAEQVAAMTAAVQGLEAELGISITVPSVSIVCTL